MTHTIWTEFLTSQTAHWQDGRVTHFGDDASHVLDEKRAALATLTNGDTHILCDLSHYSLLSATGADAQNFLQNQFCNDVHNVSPTQSQLNAYCTPKGRILAFFRLFQREDCYYLRLPQEILEPTLKRLRMYVMMSKVTLEDVSDTLMRIGFAGPDAQQRLSHWLDAVPTVADTVTQSNGLSIVCVQPGTRFEIIGEATNLIPLWGNLSAQATPVGDGSWELLEIHAAIPEVLADTQEAFVPQMINLQGINALSFKKGCYPGQEIVARMHYLGKLKRRMFIAHTDDEATVTPGNALFAEGSTSGQGVGKVVRAQSNPEGGTDLLAVIEISSAEERTLRLHDTDGALLKLLELPYMLTEEQ
ncbi:folate-binding protein YgfZ [Beggiatoa alba]|nr:folate-binding protein YgfZ [Beggiatoa alba]